MISYSSGSAAQTKQGQSRFSQKTGKSDGGGGGFFSSAPTVADTNSSDGGCDVPQPERSKSPSPGW